MDVGAGAGGLDVRVAVGRGALEVGREVAVVRADGVTLGDADGVGDGLTRGVGSGVGVSSAVGEGEGEAVGEKGADTAGCPQGSGGGGRRAASTTAHTRNTTARTAPTLTA